MSIVGDNKEFPVEYGYGKNRKTNMTVAINSELYMKFRIKLFEKHIKLSRFIHQVIEDFVNDN